MRSARVPLAALAALAIVSTPSIAANPWTPPLDIGTRWEYRGDSGGHQVQTITGQTTVRGRVVSVKSYAEGTDAGLQNYWLLDANGGLLLAGFRNPSAAVAVAYEPPLLFMPVPPGFDPYPVQHVVVHDLVTDAVVNQFDFQIQTSLLQLQLEFEVTPRFVVGVAQLSPPPGSLMLDGRHLPAGSGAVSSPAPLDFYGQVLGDVMYQSSELFSLIGYGLPTPVATSSWGALKRLYH